eukprot:TRINITY_DN2842_c0_g1_i1.p1 TRINITY_DN2842_c0_g1~~TRINITY_DN2842_c0_g1_i1.p1  ORF type:complete len:528 (+),score=172.87 TRINITY_DN2842_c0_g1_i1:73-1584(+)
MGPQTDGGRARGLQHGGYHTLPAGGQDDAVVPPLVIAAEKRRWLVLFAFCLFSASQDMVWFTYSSVSGDTLRQFFPKLSDDVANLLLNWGCIVFLPASPLVSALASTRDGLRRCFFLGATLTLAAPLCAAPVCLASAEFRSGRWALVPIHVGQMLNAVSGAVAMGLCSALSAAWFPASERNAATGIAWTANTLGNAAGYLIGPALVRTGSDFPRLIWMEIALGLSALLAGAAAFSRGGLPRHPPSAAAASARDSQLPRISSVAEFWSAVRRTPGLLPLVLVAGLQAGVFSGWSATLQELFQNTFSDTTIGWLGFSGTLGTLAGSYAAGFMGDTAPLRRRLKELAAGTMLVSGLFFSALVLVSPVTAGTNFRDPVLSVPPCVVFLFLTLACIFQGATGPVFLELGAEVGFPAVSEAVTGAMVTWVYQVGNVAFLLPPSSVLVDWGTVIQAATMLLSTAVLLPLALGYHRADHEAEAAPGPSGGSTPPSPPAKGDGTPAAADACQ